MWQTTRCHVTQQLFLELGDDRRWLPPSQERGAGCRRTALATFAVLCNDREFAVVNVMTKWTGSAQKPRNRGNTAESQRRRTRRCQRDSSTNWANVSAMMDPFSSLMGTVPDAPETYPRTVSTRLIRSVGSHAMCVLADDVLKKFRLYPFKALAIFTVPSTDRTRNSPCLNAISVMATDQAFTDGPWKIS